MFSHKPTAITIAEVRPALLKSLLNQDEGTAPQVKKLNADELPQAFEPETRAQTKLFRAPGRVNLIGEHTDYNDGFVLPSAIGFYTHIAVSPRNDGKLVLHSSEFREKFEFLVASLPPQRLGEWGDYVLGVATQLVKAGIVLSGADLMLARYCGPGLMGLGITALVAGFMAGMAGNVSAFATVWTYDIYRPYLRKDAPDQHYVSMGRWCTMIGLFVSIGTAYLVMNFASMMDYVQALFGFFIAPLFGTVVLGMLWKRVSRAAGFLGLLCGTLVSVTVFTLMKHCHIRESWVKVSGGVRYPRQGGGEQAT